MHLRRTRTASLALATLLLAAGCGGGRGEPAPGDASTPSASASAPTASSSAGSVDPADPGDDLLASLRRGLELPGVEQKVSWQFPDAYTTGGKQATLSADGVDYELSVGAKPDVDQQAEGRRLADAAGSGDTTAVADLDVAGRTWTQVTFDQSDNSLRTFLLTPDDEEATYAVLFRAGVSLQDTPPERLAEVYQMLASVELEPKEGFGS